MTEKTRILTVTCIRAWRLHRKMTLMQVRDLLESEHGVSITKTSLSRIETGKQPYSQPIVEGIAKIMGTDVASLLMLDPREPAGIWDVWSRIQTPKRTDARRILEALADPSKQK